MGLELGEKEWESCRALVEYALNQREAGEDRLHKRMKTQAELLGEVERKLSGFMLKASLIATGAGIVGAYILEPLAQRFFPVAYSLMFGAREYVLAMGG